MTLFWGKWTRQCVSQYSVSGMIKSVYTYLKEYCIYILRILNWPLILFQNLSNPKTSNARVQRNISASQLNSSSCNQYFASCLVFHPFLEFFTFGLCLCDWSWGLGCQPGARWNFQACCFFSETLQLRNSKLLFVATKKPKIYWKDYHVKGWED